jgi:transcriptional regulator with XRE-family HTH domain
LGITQSAFAVRLGVSFPRLNGIITAKRSVIPDTALRLAQVTGMIADFWLGRIGTCGTRCAQRRRRRSPASNRAQTHAPLFRPPRLHRTPRPSLPSAVRIRFGLTSMGQAVTTHFVDTLSAVVLTARQSTWRWSRRRRLRGRAARPGDPCDHQLRDVSADGGGGAPAAA